MEIIPAIIGEVAESIGQAIGRQVRYLQNSESSIVNLKNQLDELSACREQVQQKVDEADERGDRIEPDVQRWLRSVAKIIEEANELLEHERKAEMRCLHGFCPNLILCYEFGMKSTKLVQATAELYEKRNFPSISYNVSANNEYEAFDSRISTVKKIMAELRNPTTNRIGVYGIGGVGKTVLVQEIYRNAIAQNIFEDEVFVYDVKRISPLESIQKHIAEKLGMNNLENETIYGRARRLCDRMKNKKTLVILDDVQSIDLEAVGIPNVATCKVLLISRSRDIFSSYQMRTQRDFQLHVLDGDETWRLFEKTAGDVVKDPTIRTVAMQIARKCGGLPISVVTVASYLKKKTSRAIWDDALRCVMHYDVDDELSKRVYSSLQWSYNKLDEELKSLFLLCGANAGRNHISLDNLLKYSKGLGRLKKLSTTKARNALYSMVERLKDCCLLVDGNNNDLVKIDDLLRDFAIKVALRDQHILSVPYGDELPEWPNEDFLQRCTMISLPCCNIPKLPTVLESPKVQLFHVWSNNHSLDISCSFFEKMKELKVLDLTNLHIPSLPSSLQFITDLQTLCLHGCDLKDIALIGQLHSLEILSFVRSKVTHLPKELRQLSCLRVLDLTDCTELVVIFPNVISSLKRLEDLRMQNSFKQWEAEGGLGERKNARLSELEHLSQLITLAIHIQDTDFLPEGLFSNKKLDKYQILIGDEWKWGDVDESVNRLLKLKLTTINQLNHQGLQMLLKTSDSLYLDALERFRTWKLDGEDFQLKHLVVQNYAEITHLMNEKSLEIVDGGADGEEREFRQEREAVLLNLTSLIVHGCDDLKFLLSSSMTRSLVQLKHLQISECQMMEEIVLTKEHSTENTDNMFLKLEHLELNDLPKLSRFCSGMDKEIEVRDSSVNLETVVQYFLFGEKVGFPSLERLTMNDLPKFTSIWHNELAPDSFYRLKEIRVQGCDGLINMFVSNIMARLTALNTLNVKYCASLKNIFPASVAKYPQLLQELKLEDCGALVEIVAKEEGLETSMPEFVFPKVKSATFQNLPQLKRFYPGLHASKWPSLKTLQLNKCNQVESFAAEVSSFPETLELSGLSPIKQSFYLVEKDSFPKLKYLTLSARDIWYGSPGPAQFLSKLKSVEFCCTTLSMQPVVLRSCGTLPHLRSLRLNGVEELMHQWKKSCLLAGPNSGNLEILEVRFCGMKNLHLSSVSFENLMILEVTFCWQLKYLTTYSIAKSLVQLTKLKVDECKSMIEIVARDEDGDDAGNYKIVFVRLQHLELCDLISLQRFCSPSCTVEFPSLENLKVNHCPIELNLSPDRVLVAGEVDVSSILPQNQQQTEDIGVNSNTDDMLLDVLSDSRSEEAVDTTEILSLETNRNQPGPTASGGSQGREFNTRELHDEGLISELNNDGPVLRGVPETEHGVKAVIQETNMDSSQNLEYTEAMDLNKEQAVTNSNSENLHEAYLSMQETLIEPGNLIANEGKQFQLQANSRSQRLSKLDEEIRHLQEKLAAKIAERKHASERLATVDRWSDPSGPSGS